VHIRRTDRGAVRIRPVQKQPVHPLRVARRERKRRATPGGPTEHRHPLERQLVEQRSNDRYLHIKRQVPGDNVPVRHPSPDPVITDQRAPLAQRGQEATERVVAPIKLEMTYPPRRQNQRRTLTANLVGHATTGERQGTHLRNIHDHPPAQPFPQRHWDHTGAARRRTGRPNRRRLNQPADDAG
jgi:hypothetical protein